MTEPPDDNPATASVALVKAAEYDRKTIAAAIERTFELLGGIEKFVSPGDRVLIKPNFIAPRAAASAVQTHPAVILEIAGALKDFGAKPFVADSPAWKNTEACVNILGLDEPLKKLGVPVRQLNKPRKFKIAGSNISISSVALDADKIINVPKFKAHQQLVATFAVKNMFGCVPGKEKAFWHFARGKKHHDFCEMLIEIYKLLKPAMSIIDAVVAMEGMGPLSGTGRKLGFLVASADPIACEFVCARLIGLDPDQLPIVRTAKKLRFGCGNPDSIQILGDDPEELKCLDFEQARPAPLRFTFPRICMSVAKQAFLLAKAALAKIKHS